MFWGAGTALLASVSTYLPRTRRLGVGSRRSLQWLLAISQKKLGGALAARGASIAAHPVLRRTGLLQLSFHGLYLVSTVRSVL